MYRGVAVLNGVLSVQLLLQRQALYFTTQSMLDCFFGLGVQLMENRQRGCDSYRGYYI